MYRDNLRFIHERDGWVLFTAQEKVHGAPKEVYTPEIISVKTMKQNIPMLDHS